jgi:hypothetical protein
MSNTFEFFVIIFALLRPSPHDSVTQRSAPVKDARSPAINMLFS